MWCGHVRARHAREDGAPRRWHLDDSEGKTTASESHASTTHSLPLLAFSSRNTLAICYETQWLLFVYSVFIINQ